MNRVELYPYQKDCLTSAIDIIDKFGWVYLAMEVRTGKTMVSLSIAEHYKAKRVLFITKKKLVPTKKSKGSVVEDYEKLGLSYQLDVINYESIHKIDTKTQYDLIVLDESHLLGTFPKMSKRFKAIRAFLKRQKTAIFVLMSGTPSPESYSQLYYQTRIMPNGPFQGYSTFYKFAKDYVDVEENYVNSFAVKDYKKGKPKILDAVKPYMVQLTQKEASFSSSVDEEIISIKMQPITYQIAAKLKKDLVVEGKGETILADTSVKLMQKLQQIYSGTVKFESGNSMVIDDSKAKYIADRFKGVKIAIFYKYKTELDAVTDALGDAVTTDLKEFKETNKSIALQFVSGREGISLKEAEYLVAYNIDFSAVTYWQFRDRLTHRDRLDNKLYWLFAEGGIEYDVYKAVLEKKNYTLNVFKKGFNLN